MALYEAATPETSFFIWMSTATPSLVAHQKSLFLSKATLLATICADRPVFASKFDYILWAGQSSFASVVQSIVAYIPTGALHKSD
jgi:hypothetical protein